MRKQLELPEFYDFQNARNSYFEVSKVNDLQEIANIYRKRHGIKPVTEDKKRVHILVIDAQVDFSFPDGSLYVTGRTGNGAMVANQKLAEFIYRNLDIISQITCTMDTHLPFQIFYPTAHILTDGSYPKPHTLISAEEYEDGKYRPSPAMAMHLGMETSWLEKQFVHYCRQLESTGKYKLYLWPYHCMLGSRGHRLAGVIDQTRLFHSFARGAANIPEIKGNLPLTEHYSIFSPEVTTTWDDKKISGAQKNTGLIETLLKADVILVAGLASSHCVKESVGDFLKSIQGIDSTLAGKVYLLCDCTAAVVIEGGLDFTEEAEKAFQNFQNAGMHIVKSTDTVESWPGINL